MVSERSWISKETSFLALSHNAYAVRVESDGYMHPARFSLSDERVFTTHPLYRAMARTSASICLRFTALSDGSILLKRVSQSLLPKPGQQVLDLASLYGKPLDLFETIDLEIDGGEMLFLPLQTKLISFKSGQAIALHLPLHHQMTVRIEGQVAPVPKYGNTLLCLGDSIIQGVGIHHPSQSLCTQLSALLHREVVNQGLSGTLLNPDLVQPWTGGSPVRTILMHFGTNDWMIRPSLEAVKDQLCRVLDRISDLYQDCPVVVLTPLWRSDAGQRRQAGTFSELTEAITSTAQSFAQVQVIDGRTVSLRESFDDGFLHPNQEAVTHLAAALALQLA